MVAIMTKLEKFKIRDRPRVKMEELLMSGIY